MKKINGFSHQISPVDIKKKRRPSVGILEWFHFKDYNHVRRAIQQLKELGIKQIRTGFSWADYHREDGPEWFDWYIPELAKHFEVLPCFLYTPPSIGIEPKTSSPPRDYMEFGHFVDYMIFRYGDHFNYVELWNEPNNQSEYDFTLDKSWVRFAQMINFAARKAREAGKKIVLGGMSPIDFNWLQTMIDLGVLESVDVVGIHGFPGVFDSYWTGWDEQVSKLRKQLKANDLERIEVWITEAGYSTRHFDESQQLKEFLTLLKTDVPRVYWYSLNDLDESYPTVDGFHLDEREYSFGLASANKPKLLYKIIKERGIDKIYHDEWMSIPYTTSVKKKVESQKHFLITGGAGFIGTNLAKHLLQLGHVVTVFDSLARDGVESNIRWLKDNFSSNLNIIIGDVRNKFVLDEAVKGVDMVYHFAAQVAVTTSFEDPMADFEINARGTFNLLHALKNLSSPPPILFTSTNKVYGRMSHVELELQNNRYLPEDEKLRANGFDENCPLDFCSPYGCSKGTADQYVLDYAREQGLKGVVFRMSCIYGPHQCGNEDQGWVAHFLLNALKGKDITIYGDGNQVRDILYVQDLVQAMVIACNKMDKLTGEAFNIGGGTANSHSLREVIALIEGHLNKKIDLDYQGWRPGDQRYYVSDFGKFTRLTGWRPKINAADGLRLLEHWLSDNSKKSESLKLQTATI